MEDLKTEINPEEIGTRLIKISNLSYQILLKAQEITGESMGAVIYAALKTVEANEEFFNHIKEYNQRMKVHRYYKYKKKKEEINDV